MIFDIRTSSVSYNTVLYCVIDLIEEAVQKIWCNYRLSAISRISLSCCSFGSNNTSAAIISVHHLIRMVVGITVL